MPLRVGAPLPIAPMLTRESMVMTHCQGLSLLHIRGRRGRCLRDLHRHPGSHHCRQHRWLLLLLEKEMVLLRRKKFQSSSLRCRVCRLCSRCKRCPGHQALPTRLPQTSMYAANARGASYDTSRRQNLLLYWLWRARRCRQVLRILWQGLCLSIAARWWSAGAAWLCFSLA